MAVIFADSQVVRNQMIFYYSGRTTPIEQNSAEVLGGGDYYVVL